ncbi:MAG: hypothetical protein AB8B87_18305 [Granulosicoccus sp.]
MSNGDLEFVGPPLPDSGQNESRAYLARAVQAIKEGTSIAGLLRIGGAGLMVFSLCLFLMQGMDATSDLHRYLLLLGQTALLTSAGFAVGFLLKEPRGARVFFSLALVSIPANFAVLGAMIYSIVPLDSVTTQYPAYASWQSSNFNELMIASVVGMLVLIPMSIFCFAILARQSKWWLSAAYLLSSATLLIPMRETFSITLISSVCALAVVVLLSNRHAKRQRLATGEEQFAKALLFIPAALMLARSAALYNVDFHFALAVVIAIYYLLRQVVIARTENSALTITVQILSACCAFILAFMLTTLILDSFSFISPFLVFTLSWLGLNMDLTRFIDKARLKGTIHGFWAVTLFSAVAIDSLLFGNVNGFLVNLTLAGTLLVASAVTRQKLGAILGSLALIGLLIINGAHLFVFMLDTGWAGMAIAGAITIVSGSLLEKFWPVLKLRFIQQTRVTTLSPKHTDTAELPANQVIETLPGESLSRVAA